jgi:hypothetical protein
MHTSSDFLHWSEPRVIIEPEVDDPEFLQFYGMGGFRYGHYWLGTLWAYHVHDQTMDVQLAVSRDGHTWTRPFPGHRLIRLGAAGDFDSGMILSATSPVVVGDDVHLYYGGFDYRHDGSGRGAIGLATLKLDRWGGLRTGRHASLVTKPFEFNGSALTLNVDAMGGEVRAEVLDEGGQPISPFSMSESMPVTGDQIHHRLSWTQGGDLSSLQGRHIALRMGIANATVYGITPL